MRNGYRIWLLLLFSPTAVMAGELDWETFMSERDMTLPDVGYENIACEVAQISVLGQEASFKLGGQYITLFELNHDTMSETDRQECLRQAEGITPDKIFSKLGNQYSMNYSRCYELHFVGRPVNMAVCNIDVNGGTDEDILRCQSDYLMEMRFNGSIGHFQQTQPPFVRESITTSFGECAQVDIDYINRL